MFYKHEDRQVWGCLLQVTFYFLVVTLDAVNAFMHTDRFCP